MKELTYLMRMLLNGWGVDAEKDKLGLPRKGSHHTDEHHAFELLRALLSYGHSQNKRYNPVFFGVDINDFKGVDQNQVRVLSCKVDMTKVHEYLSSMEEYRVPPEAVLSCRRLRF